MATYLSHAIIGRWKIEQIVRMTVDDIAAYILILNSVCQVSKALYFGCFF